MRRRRAVAADTPPEKADPTNPKVEKTVYPRPKFNNLLEQFPLDVNRNGHGG